MIADTSKISIDTLRAHIKNIYEETEGPLQRQSSDHRYKEQYCEALKCLFAVGFWLLAAF